jgi:hypothetical protein
LAFVVPAGICAGFTRKSSKHAPLFQTVPEVLLSTTDFLSGQAEFCGFGEAWTVVVGIGTL